MNSFKRSVVSLLCLAVTGTALFAQGNIKVGMVEVHPYIDFKVVSDDNIYLDKNNEEDAVITNISPGIGLMFPIQKHKFALNYRADIQNYSVAASTNDAKMHSVDGLIDLKFPSGIVFKVKDAFKKTVDPATSELVARAERQQNNLDVEAGYMSTAGKFSAVLTYSQETHKYDEAAYKPGLNRTVDVPGINLYYNLSPKTSLLLGYDMGIINYEYDSNKNDSKYQSAVLGAKGQIAPKTVGIVKVGMQMRKYDDLKDSVTNEEEDFNEMIASLGAKTTFTSMTNLEISVSRAPVESIYAPNVYNISTVAGLKLNQKVGDKLSLSLDGSTTISDYPEASTVVSTGASKKRQDTINSVGLNASYPLQDWVTLNAGYTMKVRSSNFSDFDYTDNLISGGLRLIF
ncbi:MAG: hypothetical protein BWY26_01083 [Elusimicrobia bacterium ADurb.Bin231]|nr:MAG: hypothetical protein BWY26_01083 [Elusimicrobia bacterium ADurb.Bin231]